MAFDLDSLTNQTIEDPNATSVKPCPIGEWTARVAELRSGDTVKSWFKEVKTERGPALTMKVPFEILDEGVKSQLGRQNVIAMMDMWLDIDAAGRPTTGEGVNVKLGQLREALGLNAGAFSFTQLPGGGPVKVKVDHESAKDDPDTKYAKVVRVTKL